MHMFCQGEERDDFIHSLLQCPITDWGRRVTQLYCLIAAETSQVTSLAVQYGRGMKMLGLVGIKIQILWQVKQLIYTVYIYIFI